MTPSAMLGIVIGLDVGKPSHWACVLTREDEVLESAAVPNREDVIGALYARHPNAPVVVDQIQIHPMPRQHHQGQQQASSQAPGRDRMEHYRGASWGRRTCPGAQSIPPGVRLRPTPA